MTMEKRRWSLETISVHGGHEPDEHCPSRAVPIHQTTSYMLDSAEKAARLFDLDEVGHLYSRISNPTTEVLEKRLAMMEGGSGALVVASGQAAISTAVLNIAQKGQNIVSSSHLYGGTHHLFEDTLKRMGIDVHFVDPRDPDNFSQAIDGDTRCVYLESIPNPKNSIADFQAIADIAHDNDIPMIVDNTVTTPYLFRPFEHGADIVVYSLTKFLGGHGNSLGGAIIESGDFNWGNGKFPELTEGDPSYGGDPYWDKFGEIAYVIKARAQLLRDLGPCISPLNSFLILQGIETLSLRMKKHCENALKISRWLEEHPHVSWVNYPGLLSHQDHKLARRYLPDGYGAIVCFGVEGGIEEGRKVIDSVEMISHLANIGDSRTLIIHPATTTHKQLSREERSKAGVTDDLIRLSVGIEDVDDIISDLKGALGVIKE